MFSTFIFMFFLLLIGAVVGTGLTAWYFYRQRRKEWEQLNEDYDLIPRPFKGLDEHEDHSV